MGGTNTGAGNVTTTAEFNFWYDPEAVFVVLDRIPPTVRKLFLLSGGPPLFEKLNADVVTYTQFSTNIEKEQ